MLDTRTSKITLEDMLQWGKESSCIGKLETLNIIIYKVTNK